VSPNQLLRKAPNDSVTRYFAVKIIKKRQNRHALKSQVMYAVTCYRADWKGALTWPVLCR